ncbi:MAG TPA: hypothetical protein VEI02_06755 [Planctomycetota bacterium]|nr:hypothetical protein [Planctomycetota bacterium]
MTSRPTALLALAVPLLAASVAAAPQDSRPAADTRAASRPTDAAEADAAAVLEGIDRRLYYAEREGLTAVRFSYRPDSRGTLAADFRVVVSWKKGAAAEVAFVALDGSPLAESPKLLDQPDPGRSDRTLRKAFEEGGRSLSLMFRGTPYSEVYRDHRKRTERRTVNGREETAVICEPTTAGRFRREELHLGADGMPWKIVKRLTRPEHGMESIVLYPSFAEVAGRLAMTGYKEETAGRLDQVAIEYQRVGRFIVPASYERIIKDAQTTGRTVFDDVTVEP